jgi:hypothetical protein
MAQYNPLEIYNVYRSGKLHYYSYNEELYTWSFPKEWAQTHLYGTGPNECANCANFGCWNGVFVGYCANCAIYVYEGRRGRGFIDIGKEYLGDDALEYPSAFDTYLVDVDLVDVGDTDFCNSAVMIVPENDDCEEFDDSDDFDDSDSEEEEEEELEMIGPYDDKHADCPEEYGFISNCYYGYGSNYDGGYNSY